VPRLDPDRIPARRPGEADRFRVALPTDLARVGDVVDTVCACCFENALPSARTRFRLCTVVAEAVANAMLYGNAGDPARRVTIEVEVGPDWLVIAVSDEGDGFNHQVVPLPFGEESLEATRGRGLFMIHRLADRVEFNERGNTIWMTLPRQ
jgi:anti-sigma regulatory factor (Ser/Thr protein kinase)